MEHCQVGAGRVSKSNPGYVLIIDSNVNNLYYLSMLVQRFNYNVCTATTGNDVFELAIAAVPELVIISLDPANLPAIELVHRLKWDTRTASIPVIVISASPASELEQQCRESGVVSFLINPVPAENLFRTIQKTIERTPRENIRIQTRLSISIDDRQLDCNKDECITELSEYGMYVRTIEPCPQRTRISIRFELGGRSISGDAEVLYCHLLGEGPFKEPGMGLKLVTLGSGDRNFIKTFIRQEIMKSIP